MFYNPQGFMGIQTPPPSLKPGALSPWRPRVLLLGAVLSLVVTYGIILEIMLSEFTSHGGYYLLYRDRDICLGWVILSVSAILLASSAFFRMRTADSTRPSILALWYTGWVLLVGADATAAFLLHLG